MFELQTPEEVAFLPCPVIVKAPAHFAIGPGVRLSSIWYLPHCVCEATGSDTCFYQLRLGMGHHATSESVSMLRLISGACFCFGGKNNVRSSYSQQDHAIAGTQTQLLRLLAPHCTTKLSHYPTAVDDNITIYRLASNWKLYTPNLFLV